jgi:hypothetical protein
MKKIIVVSIISIILMTQSFAYAQGPQKMMGKKSTKPGMMGMYPGMGMKKWMMGGQMVATKDGGVIVMMGNQLLKYDKDLNLQKEVEIKMDMEKMEKMKMYWQKECPRYYKEMMEQGEMMKDTGQ